MKIALMTEGTYPYGFGGVSVWCDQLIRGMPGYEFHLVSLVATLAEPAVWILPDNVASMVRGLPVGAAQEQVRPGMGDPVEVGLVVEQLIDQPGVVRVAAVHGLAGIGVGGPVVGDAARAVGGPTRPRR